MATKADFVVVSQDECLIGNSADNKTFESEAIAIELAKKHLEDTADDEVYVYRMVAVVSNETKTVVEKVK